MLNYFIIEWLVKLLCLSGHNRKGANRTMKVKRPLCEQRNLFGMVGNGVVITTYKI